MNGICFRYHESSRVKQVVSSLSSSYAWQQNNASRGRITESQLWSKKLGVNGTAAVTYLGDSHLLAFLVAAWAVSSNLPLRWCARANCLIQPTSPRFLMDFQLVGILLSFLINNLAKRSPEFSMAGLPSQSHHEGDLDLLTSSICNS